MRALVLLVLCGCVLDADLKHRNPTVPEALGDGWEIATPESVGVDPAALAAVHEALLREDRHVGTLGFLVVKDGKLVWETYLRTPADRDRFHPIQSATKSVTSLVLGIVRDDLGGPSLDTALEAMMPDAMAGLEAAKRAITLRHLLTMTSGIAVDNSDFSMELLIDRPADPLRYILEKPLYAAPGEQYYYRDADPHLVSYALRRLTGRFEHEIAAERLFAPLGIVDYHWGVDPVGTTLGAYGLHLRPRDLAKLGQMVLDGGVWQGRRVVPRAWLDESTAPQIVSDNPSLDGSPYPYGFYWWVLPGVGFAAQGHGGQLVFVVPDRRMVIVQIAYPDTDLHGGELRHFEELIQPLLR
jgi:CubicO group peptidase (beta-lactamase class C family)